MKRLTARDWETINSALALLEASADEEPLREGDSEDVFVDRVNAARVKVQERLR